MILYAPDELLSRWTITIVDGDGFTDMDVCSDHPPRSWGSDDALHIAWNVRCIEAEIVIDMTDLESVEVMRWSIVVVS